MGGRNKKLDSEREANRNQRSEISQQQLDMANEQFAKRDQYQSPFIKQQEELASGDYNRALQVLSPQLKTFALQNRGNRESILNANVGGATRDFALLEGDRENRSGLYSFVRQATLPAAQNLYSIGQERGQDARQSLATGYSGLQDVDQSLMQQQQIEAHRRAATLSFLGSLAGGAVSLATGGLSSMFSAGSRSSSGATNSILNNISRTQASANNSNIFNWLRPSSGSSSLLGMGG